MAAIPVLLLTRPAAFTTEAAHSAAPAFLVMLAMDTSVLVSTCRSASATMDSHLDAHPHIARASQKFSLTSFDSDSLGIAKRKREKASFESEREAQGDFPWTGLLSTYGCPWWRRAWSTEESVSLEPYVPWSLV